MRVLLDADEVSRGLRRVAGEIVERNQGAENLLLVGIRRGGIPVAERLEKFIRELEGTEVPLGSIDITLYRDDAATALPNPRIGPSDIPTPLEDKRIVLVDDVLFTRRTIRAAIDALLDYGRPVSIELAVVIDRAGRQLPIQPDYRVLRVENIDADERVDVYEDDTGMTAVIQEQGAPSVPPRAL